jgi:ketosteroid isomerase-like protein
MMSPDSEELHIVKLFEDGDRALIAADVSELLRIYADDYVQYDENGKAFTREDLIRNLTNGGTRFLSMISTGRQVQLLTEDVAMVRGSEKDLIERGGNRFSIRYVYMDVVVKRGGEWRIAASQLAKPSDGR